MTSTDPFSPNGRRTALALCAVLLAGFGVAAIDVGGAGASGDAPNAYVLRGGVGVIDTGTRTSIGDVALTSASDIAFSANGSRAFVASSTSDQVAVVDTATNAVTRAIATGDAPANIAVSPSGDRVYAMLADGNLQILDAATGAQTALIPIGATGDVAITSDGATAYVGAGALHEIDLSTNTITASFGEQSSTVVLSPDDTRAYVSNGKTVGLVDLTSRTFVVTPTDGGIFASTIGHIALSPAGDRLFVGAGWHWVDTGYGAGFFPGNTVGVFDANTLALIGNIFLGSSGAGWSNQHLPSGIGVTPDRSAIYVGVPRLASVAVVNYNTLQVETLVPMTSPGKIGIAPDPDAVITPLVVNAVDDSVTSTTLGGLKTPRNALSNDRIGGAVANTAIAQLEVLSSSDPAVGLAPNGSITIAAGAAVGTHTLAYRICAVAEPTNCDDAVVTVGVRETYVIDAVADSGTGLASSVPIANVIANDTLNGVPATFTTVKLTQVSSTHAGAYIVPGDGRVFVSAAVPGGTHTIRYRICEIDSPVNCDETDVTLTIQGNVVDAVDDVGAVTRSGGTAVANVLVNDKVNALAATTQRVTIAPVSSSHAALSINTTTGAVSVAGAAPLGAHTLTYRICEVLIPGNCDTATVTVTVNPYLIDAVNDSGRGSSKVVSTIVANVLSNDRLANAIATTATVKLSKVSLVPANGKIVLNLTTGALTTTGKSNSGLYTLTYRICEKALLANCDTATVAIDLSGSGS